ncbi:Bardet-Biedl syndrome 5 protein homolog [Cotesia glomerata]|nr:Bardet-Biedl syndrome 5 protein homolog [Cotesia glomerata]
MNRVLVILILLIIASSSNGEYHPLLKGWPKSFIDGTMASIKTSKFGPTLVIISTKPSNGYVLGFRVDPVQKLHTLNKEIQTLKISYGKSPIFGVEYTFEYQGVIEPEVKEEVTKEIQDSNDEISNVFGLYFADDGTKQHQPKLDSYLGLAAEEPRPGISLQSLWELIPGNP